MPWSLTPATHAPEWVADRLVLSKGVVRPGSLPRVVVRCAVQPTPTYPQRG